MGGVALVTGSGKRRVGWHVADALAARGYGLVLHYRTAAAEANAAVAAFKARGVEAVAVQADVADEAAKGDKADKAVVEKKLKALANNCTACHSAFRDN